MKKIRIMMSLISKNIIVFFIPTIGIYLVIQSIILSLFFAFFNIKIIAFYKKEKKNFEMQMVENFQINNFIKNMAINSIANNFNVLDSIEKSIQMVDGEFKKDIENLYSEIKKNYNYETAFSNLKSKYKNDVFEEFINNLLIIKEQSNVEESAKKIFEIASKDMQRKIITEDKILKIQKGNLNNYLVNVALGYFVIILVVISLNVYYIEFARSIDGLILNSFVIFIMQIVTSEIIKNTFKRRM